MVKLNIIWDTDNGVIFGEGFINGGPFINTETDTIKRLNPQNLDSICDNGECEEIIAHDVIQYLPVNKVVETITHWVGKLAHKGIIRISADDCYEICRNFTRYNITLLECNTALYGRYSEKPYLQKRAQFTLKGLTELLVQLGLKITKKRLDQTTMKMEVEAIRP